MTEPDPEAIRLAIVDLVSALEHDPNAVTSIHITPGIVVVEDVTDLEDGPGSPVRMLTYTYRWSNPLLP